MAKSLDDIFGTQQNQPRTLDQIFTPPAPAPVAKPPSLSPVAMQMKSSHAPEPPKPSYKNAFISGTLNSLAGKTLTPIAEKITRRKVDLSTLPQPEGFGQKAVAMGSSLVADLPVWMTGDALLAKPLGALAKTAPMAKGISKLPKAITPALGTGVRAGATYGGVVAPAETLVHGDGLQGLAEREKQVPLMALGGTALHGAGQLAVKGAKTGIDYAKFNKLTKLPEMKANPLEDVQNAYKQPGIKAEVKAVPNQLSVSRTAPIDEGLSKQYGNVSKWDESTFKTTLDALKTDNEEKVDAILKSYLSYKPQGVMKGGIGRDAEGEVVTAWGNISNNEPWYQAAYQKYGHKPNKQELREFVTDELKNGRSNSLEGNIPPDPSFIQNEKDIANLLHLRTPQNYKEVTTVNLPKSNQVSFPEPKLKAGELPKPQPRETIDIEMPVVNNRADLKNIVERHRTMSAEIERPNTTIEIPSTTARPPRGTPEPPTTGGNADTFRAKIDRNPAKRKTFSETLKGLRTQFVDDLAPLENLEKNVSGKVASAEDSLYKQGRLFRGSPERADELIKSRLAPVIKGIEKSGKSSKDLGDYALAVHARDVNAKGINSGFTNEEISATIQKYGTPEMETARKELMKVSNDLLDELAESGLISRELVTVLKEKHPNYMPLFRSFDDEKIEFSSGLSKTLANVSAPIQRLKGSERNVIDPIESMIKNIYKSVSAVDRNKVASQLGKLADNDTNAAFIRRLPEGEEKARLNAVYAMENGKKVYYEVQPDVYKALMNLDKESSNMLIKMLQKPASLLRAGATLTPEFSLRNPMRDVVQAYAVSKSGFNPITDTAMGLIDVIKSKYGKETLYNQFLKDNAGFGNIISMDRKAHQEVMNGILKQPASKKFVNVLSGKSLINVLRTITDVTESATKLGEYRAALRSGASRPEAAYRARDLMDFARAGASVRETNKIVAFLNANVQGKSKLYRAIKENPIGVTARAFTSITLPTIGVYMAQKNLANEKQKAIIDDAPDWMTSTFWLMPIPGTNQVARIPKPFDMAPIFANLPERILKYVAEKDPKAFEGFGKQTLASASIPTMITGLIPFIEGMANYSFFRQAPIIPQRESDLNYPDQYDIRTTETAKFLAKGVNKLTGGQGALKNFGSPRIMDNTIRGATAGLGGYATSAIDFITESTGIVDKKQKPARNVSELPLLRAFLTSEKSGGKAMDKLYTERDKLTREKGSAKIDKLKLPKLDRKRLDKLNSAAGDIGDITKKIRKIENDRNINPQLKREQINALTTKRNELARKVMQ